MLAVVDQLPSIELEAARTAEHLRFEVWVLASTGRFVAGQSFASYRMRDESSLGWRLFHSSELAKLDAFRARERKILAAPLDVQHTLHRRLCEETRDGEQGLLRAAASSDWSGMAEDAELIHAIEENH